LSRILLGRPPVPSQDHEVLVSLFQNRPELAPILLREALGVELPRYTEARLESGELTEVVPTEYHADLVVLLVDGKPVLGIVVEVRARPKTAQTVHVAKLRLGIASAARV
jgi:hypothetical protein